MWMRPPTFCACLPEQSHATGRWPGRGYFASFVRNSIRITGRLLQNSRIERVHSADCIAFLSMKASADVEGASGANRPVSLLSRPRSPKSISANRIVSGYSAQP